MPYFGRWPEWMNLYIESCKWNPTIDWLFLTDCGEPENKCSNVNYVHLSIEEMEALIIQKLGIEIPLVDQSYKLCDIRPAYGILFEEHINGYDYFGYGDIDVIYGNIRKFYTNEVLKYNFISTHTDRLAGHFSLLENIPKVKNAFRKIPNWQQLIKQTQINKSFDECYFSNHVLWHGRYPFLKRKIAPLFGKPVYSILCVERYSTILSPHKSWLDGSRVYPSEWYWKEGRLTNDKDGDREFMYLHFMNWKSSKYILREKDEKAAWETLDKIVHLDDRKIKNGFKVNRYGFFAL